MERLSGSNSVTGSSASKPEPSSGSPPSSCIGRVGRFGGIHRHSFRRFLRLTGMPRGASERDIQRRFIVVCGLWRAGFGISENSEIVNDLRPVEATLTPLRGQLRDVSSHGQIPEVATNRQ